MDVNALHECFQATLQADVTVRTHAEQQLLLAAGQVGFLGACLDILDNQQVSPIVKQACSIYFKNKIMKQWSNEDAIDADERPIIRERIMFVMVKLERQLTNQLIPALAIIVSYDYPNNWSNFLDLILKLLSNSNDLRSIYIGVLGFSELCRSYRWKKNEVRSEKLDPIIEQYFPSLLQLSKSIISSPSDSYECGEIVKLVLKCYKFVTYLDLPLILQQNQMVVDWITFHVDVINMSLPESVFKLPVDERSNSPWVKCQKWSCHNLHRIYERYGSKTLSSRFEYVNFIKVFANDVLPSLFQVYVQKLQLWNEHKQWISSHSLYYMISLIEHCCVPKESWEMVIPHLDFLISKVTFNIFRPSDETLEMFENEPEEYIHSILDQFEDISSPENAIISFLFTLVEKRGKTTLQPLMTFIYDTLNQCNQRPASIENAKDMESAMRMLGPLANKLSRPSCELNSQMEDFLKTFIFPNFQSQYPFLRARACNVSSKFDELDIKDPNYIQSVFNGVMQCFQERDQLPVQIEASLALQSFLKFDEFKYLLSGIIVPTMEQLLELSNKFDSDMIPMVMQECVESFSDQLEPFAENLMAKLSEQVLRLLEEMNDGSNQNVDDFVSNGYDDLSDKQTAILGIVNTMITVLLYFEKSSEAIVNLEPYYSPVIQYIFERQVDDFYGEASELIENTLFLTRKVSDNMWRLFESFVKMLINDDTTLFLEDSLPALKNYLVYGKEVIKTNENVQNIMIQLIMKILSIKDSTNEYYEDEEIGSTDICQMSELATYFILALDQTSTKKFVPHLIEVTMKHLSTDDPAYKSNNVKIQIINVILASLVIDPTLSLQKLFELNSFERFLTIWFELNNNDNKLTRVFDIKLNTLASISIMSLPMDALTQLGVSSIMSQFGLFLTSLIVELPHAIANLEKKRREYEPGFETEGKWANEETYDINDDILGTTEGGEDDELTEEGGDFDDFKFTESGQFKFFDDMDELDEDPYSQNALENINVFEAFKVFCYDTQNNDSGKYQSMFSSLNQEQQEALHKVLDAVSK